MKVKCLECGREMIADEKHTGYQTCGCRNQTMVDYADQWCCRFGGLDPSKIEIDGKRATGEPKRRRRVNFKWLKSKALHLALTFVLGVAIATAYHLIVTNQQVRKTAEAVCTVFGRDEQECKDGIDDLLDESDNTVDNNININGGEE